MAVYQLVYASRPTALLAPRQIGAILNEAVVNNQRIDVTGVLLVGKDYFFQCLEGEEQAVEELYATITGDPRHCEVVRLHSGWVEERLFRGWSMKLFPSTALERQLTAKVGAAQFTPTQLDQGQVKAVLQHISTNREALAALARHRPETAPVGFWRLIRRRLTFRPLKDAL